MTTFSYTKLWDTTEQQGGEQRSAFLRIPAKPATYSNLMPATYSDTKPATVPI